MIYKSLNPEKALIWRITHIDNLPWILANGLHCANSGVVDPGFVSIGNGDLIDRRRFRSVPISPGGTLADYIPFYFTPFSVMLLNIKSGRGVKKRPNSEIVILVSSMTTVATTGGRVIFTDAHALPAWTSYYDDFADLAKIDWSLLQRRDFRRDPDDLKKIERYQAEALVHRHLPISSILGVITYDDPTRELVEAHLARFGLSIPAYSRPGWYF